MVFFINFANFYRTAFFKIPLGECFWTLTFTESCFSIEGSWEWFALMAAANRIVITQLAAYG